MARPVKPVDLNLLDKLAEIQCSVKEMSFILGVSEDTLNRRYAAVLEKGRNKGKRALRQSMYDKAIDGNVVMQIWLSKNWLGMADKVETSIDAKVNAPSQEEIQKQICDKIKEIEAKNGTG